MSGRNPLKYAVLAFLILPSMVMGTAAIHYVSYPIKVRCPLPNPSSSAVTGNSVPQTPGIQPLDVHIATWDHPLHAGRGEIDKAPADDGHGNAPLGEALQRVALLGCLLPVPGPRGLCLHRRARQRAARDNAHWDPAARVSRAPPPFSLPNLFLPLPSNHPH